MKKMKGENGRWKLEVVSRGSAVTIVAIWSVWQVVDEEAVWTVGYRDVCAILARCVPEKTHFDITSGFCNW